MLQYYLFPASTHQQHEWKGGGWTGFLGRPLPYPGHHHSTLTASPLLSVLETISTSSICLWITKSQISDHPSSPYGSAQSLIWPIYPPLPPNPSIDLFGAHDITSVKCYSPRACCWVIQHSDYVCRDSEVAHVSSSPSSVTYYYWSWAIYLTCLCSNFPIYKTGLKIIPSPETLFWGLNN